MTHRLPKFALFCMFVAVAPGALAQAQIPTAPPTSREQVLKYYAEHNEGIRKALPPYSSMPALLDLTGRTMQDAFCDPDAHSKFEDKFKFIMGGRPFTDVGVPNPKEWTSTALTTIDYVNGFKALPVEGISGVIMARVRSSRVCLSRDLQLVYTRFRLEITDQFLKKKQRALPAEVDAAEFIGSVLYPSGQLTTFLIDNSGSLSAGKEYVLFLWQPIRDDKTFVESEAYLVQDGRVYPTETKSSAAKNYTGMALAEFRKKVQAAVDKRKDTD